MTRETVTIGENTTGRRLELPVLRPVLGPPVLDIGRLYRDLGYFTYDPGFLATASCRSSVTFIDGEKGVLLYRGYPIEQLAECSSFIEVAYLLLYGELPHREQLDTFTDHINRHTMINESLKRFYDGFYHDAHPMAIMVGVVRLAGRSGANPFACIASGIAALWGPAHGGANEAALKMLEEIGTVKNVPKYIARAKDKNDSFRLMGFGHCVYKSYDPRARVIRTACHEVLAKLGDANDPLFELALEDMALKDDYFIEHKLYPNVDFYSGLICKALGIPANMFTVMFAIARTVGWVSQWTEMIAEPEQRIGRPRQLYVGSGRRDYLPMAQRLSAESARQKGSV